MPQKRKKNGFLDTRWEWVGAEVTESAGITSDHILAACNLSPRNRNVYCTNKYSSDGFGVEKNATAVSNPDGLHTKNELDEDIIVISDDDESSESCSPKSCKRNPYCLNYLGQEMWEHEDAMVEFTQAAKLGVDPSALSRQSGAPVGLKNLGATCYANSSLQVWFRFEEFRSAVYACGPPHSLPEEKYKDSPMFQLQVTFAALQEGSQKVYDPTKLIESLQLRTSEQQDAQEFAKLFMTHLDAEFKKQNAKFLRSMITDQFQGTGVYSTICHSCQNRSETTFDFLELEISFKNDIRLEDCIAASLLPETLSGDNKYRCPRCETLQEATRYTELRKLPPILHFSLMRFVYDLKTMERKKSKLPISFPLTLDMTQFLGTKDDRECEASRNSETNLYDLRGILLHKGESAYHGHYEAQVYDAEHDSWFQFDDEEVTRINVLGDKAPKKQNNDPMTNAERPDAFGVRKKRAFAKKRRRIEDSDDGGDALEVEAEGRASQKRSIFHGGDEPSRYNSNISSRDAYMLIYSRRISRSHDDSSQSDCTVTKPSSGALRVVQGLNDAHQAACERYLQKAKETKAMFADLRVCVRSIYGKWFVTPDSSSFVVSRQALECWLSTYCIAAAVRQDDASPLRITDPHSSAEAVQKIAISCADIICEHGCLDPKKFEDMKCITSSACEDIALHTNCFFTPALQPSDACPICVANEFQEKLYEVEHPHYVKQVEAVSEVLEGELGYWISKRWYKDWRLLKPRMHVTYQDDPPPDSSEFHNHIYCEHKNLTLSATNRRKISAQAVVILQVLFPEWDPLPTDAEACAICEADIHIFKEDKRVVRKRIEHEKALLRFFVEPSLDKWTKQQDSLSHAILPFSFVRSWKRWVSNPSEHPRPEKIDNTPFLCQHEMLTIDPNCQSDLDSSITIIQRDEWDVLNSVYEGGPLIALTKNSENRFQHDIPICEGCHIRRKTEWEMADIVISLDDPNGRPMKQSIATYQTNGARQSKRLRQINENGKRRLVTVRKSSTLKDIKVLVEEAFSLPTICQRLFYRGQEIEDNSVTVESLKIFANDVIYVREVEEIIDITSDGEVPRPKKQRRKERPGFIGTLLGNADVTWCSSPTSTPPQRDKTCSACTYSNTYDALHCQICDTAFV